MGQSPLFPGLNSLWGIKDYGKTLSWMFLLLQVQLNVKAKMERLKVFWEFMETTFYILYMDISGFV